MVIRENLDNRLQLRLLPNRSATWKQTKCMIGLVSIATLLIAVFWTLQGAWMVLPFAGLELVVLALLAHRVCWDSYHQQVIILGDDQVEVQWGMDAPKKRWLFKRYGMECLVFRPLHSLSAERLELRSRDRFLPIGERLNKEDISQLIQELQTAGLPCRMIGRVQRVAVDGFGLDDPEQH